jgi:hypothetical protein
LAKELGNVAEACRQRGLDRTSFYEWKRRFQTQGFGGLKDLPPIHRSHPQTTPPETVERIKELALAHSAYGCNRQSPPPRLAGGRDQHLVAVLGNVDAYQNTGICSMLQLGHSRSPLRWVVRNTTIET